jgi:hypothetical protein
MPGSRPRTTRRGQGKARGGQPHGPLLRRRYLWKEAVEKAGSFDVDKVRDVLESGDISFDGPGGKITMQKNHHATKNVYIGETKADGQFKIIKTFTLLTASRSS